MRISDWSSDVCSSDLGWVTTQPYRPRELGERPLSCAPMAYTEISYEERDDHVGLLTIQRPDARNALTFTTYAEMEEVVRTTTARCLVITGADPAFCRSAERQVGERGWQAG